jgi:putative thioredoxin
VSEASSAWIVDVTEVNFEREVLERSKEAPVVVDFWAPWCGPCQMLGPVLERLVNERQGEVRLAKINVDVAQQLAAAFSIQSIPAIKAFRDGQLIFEFVGVLPEAQLREVFDRLRPSEADNLAKEAQEQEATDSTAAEQKYRKSLELDREHEASLVGLARVLLARGQDADVSSLLDRALAGGEQAGEVSRLRGILALKERAREFGDEASLRNRLAAEPGNAALHHQLGTVLAASGKYPEALEELLSAAREDKKLANEKVKEVMVQVFHVVGVRSPLAEEYRDKLTRVLY